MKDHRFIELVNLYIDRQITAAETAELEAEIQGNPQRRAVYRQYCQMHRATTLVYDSFRSQAPRQPAAEPVARNTIELFENRQRSRRYRWAYYASGLVAAACLALVFVRLNSGPAEAPATTVAAVGPRPAPVVAKVVPIVPPDSANAQEMDHLSTGPVSLRNVTDSDYAVLMAAMHQDEQQRNQAERLTSLFEDGVFESRQVLTPANQRTFRSRQTPAQQAEFTAFQFQR